jgi:predicted nucleotide-binding protein
MANSDFLFISYVREDARYANGPSKALHDRGIRTWVDTQNLMPGDQWETSIRRALEDAAGIVFIVTEASMRSPWVMYEVRAGVEKANAVYPVVIGDWSRMPDWLAQYQGILLPDVPGDDDFTAAATQLAKALGRQAASPSPKLPSLENLAPKIAAEARRTGETPPDEAPDSVFLVHGHNDTLLLQVEAFIETLGIRPVVLRKIGGPSMSLLGKFLSVGSEARFAVVILSADDLGASRRQYNAPNVGERALQFRARQNVILELGFFFGSLGWEKVFVLHQEADQVFPNFELPSDIHGMVPVRIDATDKWKADLAAKLTDAGFRLRVAETR